MYASHLCRLACGDAFIKKKFGGVFPCDGLPKHKAGFLYFIVNLDPKHLPGSHWIAIAFKKNVAFYFDSYGRPPLQKDILNFMNGNSQIIRYNSACFQSSKTATCGLFSLYFLHRFSRDLSMKHLEVKNTDKNEIFIRQFSNQNLSLARCCHNFPVSKQTCRALLNMKSTNDLF